METQRILMRSLAVVVFASVIWTITVSADANQKEITCCRVVSKTKLTDPIIGFRVLNESLPCLKAVIFKTERGEFCLDWRPRWVKDEVKKLLRAQRNKSLTSTPPPASSISKLTPVGGSSQSPDRSSIMNI